MRRLKRSRACHQCRDLLCTHFVMFEYHVITHPLSSEGSFASFDHHHTLGTIRVFSCNYGVSTAFHLGLTENAHVSSSQTRALGSPPKKNPHRPIDACFCSTASSLIRPLRCTWRTGTCVVDYQFISNTRVPSPGCPLRSIFWHSLFITIWRLSLHVEKKFH